MSAYSLDLRQRAVAAVAAGLPLQTAARTQKALKAITATDAHAFFHHCGYRSPAQ